MRPFSAWSLRLGRRVPVFDLNVSRCQHNFGDFVAFLIASAMLRLWSTLVPTIETMCYTTRGRHSVALCSFQRADVERIGEHESLPEDCFRCRVANGRHHRKLFRSRPMTVAKPRPTRVAARRSRVNRTDAPTRPGVLSGRGTRGAIQMAIGMGSRNNESADGDNRPVTVW